MYAVVNINGHQYKVSPTQTLVVDRLQGRSGEVVQFSPLLVVDNDVVKVGNEATAFDVTTKIVDHRKGDKVDVARFRAKSRYRRRRGFRPQTTTLLVEGIAPKKAVIVTKKTQTRKQRSPIRSKT